MEIPIDRTQAIETIRNFLITYKLTDHYLETYDDKTLQQLTKIVTNQPFEYNEEEDIKGLIANYMYIYEVYQNKNIKKAYEYLVISVLKHNSHGIHNLASILSYQQENKTLAAVLYKKNIDMNNYTMSLNCYGTICYNIGNCDEAEKYYLMAIDINVFTPTITNLRNVYLKMGNIDKYYRFLESNIIKYKNDTNIKVFLDAYFDCNKSIIEKYQFLQNFDNNKNDIIKNYLDELENHQDVKVYKTKVENSIKTQCLMCLTDDIDCIALNCMHYQCLDCYPLGYTKCSICG